MIKMRYPIIKVQQIPPLYKHCMIVKAAFFRFDKLDEYYAQQDDEIKKQYIEQIKKEILKAIEAQFISTQAQQIKYKDVDFIIFRSNFDMKLFTILITNLFKEVSEYVEGCLDFYYGVIDVMIYQDGKEPTMIGSMKMGEDVFESNVLTKAYKQADASNIKGHPKYLTSFSEFYDDYLAQADNYCI